MKYNLVSTEVRTTERWNKLQSRKKYVSNEIEQSPRTPHVCTGTTTGAGGAAATGGSAAATGSGAAATGGGAAATGGGGGSGDGGVEGSEPATGSVG